MKSFKIPYIFFLIAFALTATSCTSTKTALFDHYSYQKTTEIKTEATELMEKATTSYPVHQKEVETLLLNVQKLVEYEKNKPNNEITFAMWTVLNDKEKNLLIGFFSYWKTKGTVSQVFLEESKKQVTGAFDLLIQYESKKDRESKDALSDLINGNN